MHRVQTFSLYFFIGSMLIVHLQSPHQYLKESWSVFLTHIRTISDKKRDVYSLLTAIISNMLILIRFNWIQRVKKLSPEYR